MGEIEVIKNLLKIIRTAEIMLLTPINMGLKNIILVSRTVVSFLSPENPGTIKEIICGAKIKRTAQTIIKENKNKFKRFEK